MKEVCREILLEGQGVGIGCASTAEAVKYACDEWHVPTSNMKATSHQTDNAIGLITDH